MSSDSPRSPSTPKDKRANSTPKTTPKKLDSPPQDALEAKESPAAGDSQATAATRPSPKTRSGSGSSAKSADGKIESPKDDAKKSGGESEGKDSGDEGDKDAKKVDDSKAGGSQDGKKGSDGVSRSRAGSSAAPRSYYTGLVEPPFKSNFEPNPELEAAAAEIIAAAKIKLAEKSDEKPDEKAVDKSDDKPEAKPETKRDPKPKVKAEQLKLDNFDRPGFFRARTYSKLRSRTNSEAKTEGEKSDDAKKDDGKSDSGDNKSKDGALNKQRRRRRQRRQGNGANRQTQTDQLFYDSPPNPRGQYNYRQQYSPEYVPHYQNYQGYAPQRNPYKGVYNQQQQPQPQYVQRPNRNQPQQQQFFDQFGGSYQDRNYVSPNRGRGSQRGGQRGGNRQQQQTRQRRDTDVSLDSASAFGRSKNSRPVNIEVEH